MESWRLCGQVRPALLYSTACCDNTALVRAGTACSRLRGRGVHKTRPSELSMFLAQAGAWVVWDGGRAGAWVVWDGGRAGAWVVWDGGRAGAGVVWDGDRAGAWVVWDGGSCRPARQASTTVAGPPRCLTNQF